MAKRYPRCPSQASAEARVDAISENARLKDENKRLRMELEIVKSGGLLCGPKVDRLPSSRPSSGVTQFRPFAGCWMCPAEHTKTGSRKLLPSRRGKRQVPESDLDGSPGLAWHLWTEADCSPAGERWAFASRTTSEGPWVSGHFSLGLCYNDKG